MTKEQLTSLAERVMGLTGPDREVDREIGWAIGYIISDQPDGRVQCHGNGIPRTNRRTLPFYTASLDAAMSLAGDDFGSLMRGRFLDGSEGFVALVKRREANAKTAANAVTAAALLARAAECGE